MAIEGLRTVPQPSEVSISDQVGASVEALDILGLVEDRDLVTESVTAEFRGLSKSGRTGEAFVQLPRSVITLADLVQASDSATYSGDRQYPETYVYRELWTPGFDKDGYKAEELDNLTLGGNGDFTPHARLAVHNPASEQEPLLHFLGKPFDKKYAEKGQQTQLEAVEEAVKAYESEGHEDFAMTPLNAKAVAFIALTRRIKGETMPMAWGYMRDATLPRKEVDGYSVVGYVGSGGGGFLLGGSRGGADSSGGVGLSVGSKELKS
jgi:hypothetical protein